MVGGKATKRPRWCKKLGINDEREVDIILVEFPSSRYFSSKYHYLVAHEIAH